MQEVAVAQICQVDAGIGIHPCGITTYARSNTFSHAVADVKGRTVATLHGAGSGHTHPKNLSTLGPVVFGTVRIGRTIVILIYGCYDSSSFRQCRVWPAGNHVVLLRSN